MAKKKPAKQSESNNGVKVNKSQAIRDYKYSNPDHGPTEITKALAAQGISVTPALVSNVLQTAKSKDGSEPIKRGPKAKGTVASFKGVDRGALEAAADFIEKAGGFEAAKSLLQTAERFSKFK